MNKKYHQGYNFAAGALLQSDDKEQTIAALENNIDCSNHFGIYNEFDDGIEDALNDWSKLEDKTK